MHGLIIYSPRNNAYRHLRPVSVNFAAKSTNTNYSHNMKRTLLSALLMLVMAVYAQAQDITVHGSVCSITDDEPFIGATV